MKMTNFSSEAVEVTEELTPSSRSQTFIRRRRRGRSRAIRSLLLPPVVAGLFGYHPAQAEQTRRTSRNHLETLRRRRPRQDQKGDATDHLNTFGVPGTREAVE